MKIKLLRLQHCRYKNNAKFLGQILRLIKNLESQVNFYRKKFGHLIFDQNNWVIRIVWLYLRLRS